MGRISTVPINNFQGTQTSPAVSVPAGAIAVSIDFDGTTMLNPAIQVDTKVEFSPDGGTTWLLEAESNFQCGSLDRQGNPRAVYNVTGDIPAEGASRKLRGTLTVTGGPLTTTLHISTLP